MFNNFVSYQSIEIGFFVDEDLFVRYIDKLTSSRFVAKAVKNYINVLVNNGYEHEIARTPSENIICLTFNLDENLFNMLEYFEQVYLTKHSTFSISDLAREALIYKLNENIEKRKG